jgi:predicted SpoU family rRNA methylase
MHVILSDRQYGIHGTAVTDCGKGNEGSLKLDSVSTVQTVWIQPVEFPRECSFTRWICLWRVCEYLHLTTLGRQLKNIWQLYLGNKVVENVFRVK